MLCSYVVSCHTAPDNRHTHTHYHVDCWHLPVAVIRFGENASPHCAHRVDSRRLARRLAGHASCDGLLMATLFCRSMPVLSGCSQLKLQPMAHAHARLRLSDAWSHCEGASHGRVRLLLLPLRPCKRHGSNDGAQAGSDSVPLPFVCVLLLRACKTVTGAAAIDVETAT